MGFSTNVMSPYLNGFHMTFANGWTVSVQFGKGNYISDRAHTGKSVDAELAAWDADGNWYKFDSGDTVSGWNKPDDVLAFMNMIAAK